MLNGRTERGDNKLNILDQFMAAFQVPGFVKPYLHHFVTEQEMELVTRMQGRNLTRDQIDSLFEGSLDIDCLLEQVLSALCNQ